MLPPLELHAVLLDLDGLLIDSEPIYRLAWQSAAADLGYELTDALYLTLIGLSDHDSERILIQAFGPNFPLAQFRVLWPAWWRRQLEVAGIPVKPGLWEFLKVMEKLHLPTAVATSSDGEQAEMSLRAAGLSQRFSCVVTGDQVFNGKPAPDIFLEAARRLAVHPQNCIVLEDSDAGILAAAAAGIPALVIPDLKPPSGEAAAVALGIFSSLKEAAEFVEDIFQSQGHHSKNR